MNVHLAPAVDIGNPALNITIFGVFVVVTLAIVIRASRNNRTAADFYAGGRSFTGPQNGTAIAGDYLSAASFLGIAGAIALNGYDGFLYSIGFLVAWLVALLLVAELLRNTGKFTMADVLSFRLRQRPIRMAAALCTLAVCFFYLLAQMAGAGGLVALLLGVTGTGAQYAVVAVVGLLMIVYVLVGGMKGTTWVQIIKAVLLIVGAGVMTVWVLAQVRLQPLRASSATSVERATSDGVENAGALLDPGKQYGATDLKKIDFISLSLALVLGTAGPAARADALLHGALRQGGPAQRGLGDLADRPVLPVQPVLGLRRRRARRPGRDQGGTRRGQLGRPAAGVRARRDHPAGPHLGGGLRHDPRRGRRSHHHRGDLVRPRHLRQRDQARRGRRRTPRSRSPAAPWW